MSTLTDLAKILTNIPLQEVYFIGQVYAAPCFNFYGDASGEPYNLDDLYSNLKMEISAAMLEADSEGETDVQAKLEKVKEAINNVAPPSA